MRNIFRGMFGQPKDLPSQFSGRPIEVFESFAIKMSYQIIKNADGIVIKKENREINIKINNDNLSFTIIMPSSYTSQALDGLGEFDQYFGILNINNSFLISREVSLKHQGDPLDTVEKAIDHVLISIYQMKPEQFGGHFRPYLNGKTYGTSWQAFAHFMKNIKGDRVTSEAGHYISFDTGGLPLGLQKSDNSQEIIISYDLRDYEGLYDEYREQILELINGVALRHRQICFLIDRERLLICNKFYVSPETDALNLFTAQLQAIHDALLDYLTTVQDAPENAWLRAAREAFVRGQPLPRA